MTPAELEHALRSGADSPSCVEQVARYFSAYPLHYGHGTTNAADEAYWLVRAVQDWDDSRWRGRVDARQLERIIELARQRVELRKPLAYLLGEAWFAKLKFSVDERVLVPRSPLAELIEAQFAPWCRLEPGDRVLDIGTGSGCLAIATAVHCPDVAVDATDISSAALAAAKTNVAAIVPGPRVTLLEADLFPERHMPYGVIVSNPPYVPAARLAELPAEYAHEPRLALNGGQDGLDVVRRIVERAPDHLASRGVLIVEVGETAQAFSAAYPTLPVTWLEFEHGGEGVFLITREELTGHSAS